MKPYKPGALAKLAATCAIAAAGVIGASANAADQETEVARVAAVPSPAAAAATTATAAPAANLQEDVRVQQVEKLHAALLEAMKGAEELGYEGRAAKVRAVVPETFDSRFMASKVIGRHWKKLDDEQKERWTQTFRNLTIANLAGRFDRYSGESFETLGHESAARETELVRTVVHVPDGDDVQLNYRLIEGDDGWRICDVYFNGTVSEVALRRSDYASLLKAEGLEKLIEVVDQQIADLSSGKLTGL